MRGPFSTPITPLPGSLFHADPQGTTSLLPNDVPPWQTVYWWFRRFVRRLLFRTIHDVTLMLDRERAYDRTRLMDAAACRDFVLEIIRRTDKDPGFKVLPRRWVVERTFGWMTRWKRLVRDCEQRLDASGAMIHVALGSLMLRRIGHPRPFSNGP